MTSVAQIALVAVDSGLIRNIWQTKYNFRDKFFCFIICVLIGLKTLLVQLGLFYLLE